MRKSLIVNNERKKNSLIISASLKMAFSAPADNLIDRWSGSSTLLSGKPPLF